MKKTFESLKSNKFASLSIKSLSKVTGGGDTGGGSKVTMRQNNNVYYPNEGVYHWTDQNYVRSWTSDAIMADGSTCYWGETYTWVNA